MTEPRDPNTDGEEPPPGETTPVEGYESPAADEAPYGGDQQAYDQTYDQQGYDQQGYDQQAYDQQAYDQQAYDPAYAQGAYEQGVGEQAAYDAAYGQDQYEQPAADYGTGADAAGSPYQLHDPMADMYVKKEKVAHGPLTIMEGPPPVDDEPTGRSLGSLILGMFLVCALAVCLISMVMVKKTVVDAEGADQRVSLGRWLGLQVTMPPAQKKLQKLTPDERAFYLTYRRIFLVREAVSDYQATRGELPPNSLRLSDAGLLTDQMATDGWGNIFTISRVNNQMVVISPGSDGLPYNADDIMFNGSNVNAPAEFENLAIELDLGEP